MESPLNTIGPQVRQLRHSAGLTQEQLAARCQRFGLNITRVAVANIEASTRSVSDHEIPFLAQALSAPIAALFPRKPVIVKRKLRNPKGPSHKTKPQN
jgi:transcriptional regulator with XRE-family HTH domain